MASTASQSQPNGVPSSSSAGPSQSQTQPTQSSSSTAVAGSQATTGAAATAAPGNNGPGSPTTSAPRPRDARTIELLLTSQGVTSYDNRVPLLLLDFAYRHTSSILSDALHLAADPYTAQAGSKPSGSSGVAPSAPNAADAHVGINAINIAIASRQAYQFRGGSGSAGGGASKEWMLELAKDRNKIAIQRPPNHEWGLRLPNERFVLSGTGWGLKDRWAGSDDDEDDDDEEDDENMEDAMEGIETVKKETDGKAAEEGGLEELLGDDVDADEDMEGME